MFVASAQIIAYFACWLDMEYFAVEAGHQVLLAGRADFKLITQTT